MPIEAEIQWQGAWEHACGATGETLWDDEDTPQAGHECGQDGPLSWYGEWHCHGCGASGDEQWDGDATPYADHVCDEQEETS